jgi:hypothetical protein
MPAAITNVLLLTLRRLGAEAQSTLNGVFATSRHLHPVKILL